MNKAITKEKEKSVKTKFFERLKHSLSKTKENFGYAFISSLFKKQNYNDFFEKLEKQLLIADVGLNTTRKIIANLTKKTTQKQLNSSEELYSLLKNEMHKILKKVDKPLVVENEMLFTILVIGVNGVGKTTTAVKLANRFNQQGKSVMLAAGDTFRAAAVEQLQNLGRRNNIPVISRNTPGTDSASVIFDAIQDAKRNNINILIADTAGRFQNKIHLMEELKKIIRVMKRKDSNSPHEVMLVIDAGTGQNAVSQVKSFYEAAEVSGIILTKFDGTAKGGIIFAIADQFEIPIRYISTGECIEDLHPFNVEDFIETLFVQKN